LKFHALETGIPRESAICIKLFLSASELTMFNAGNYSARSWNDS